MKSIFSALLLLISVYGIGQKANKTYPSPIISGLPFVIETVEADAPEWVKLLYSPNPNIERIEQMYSQWREANPTLKNGHTRNFKHLYNYLSTNDGITADGFIKQNLIQDIELRNTNWSRQKEALQRTEKTQTNRSANNTTWTPLGPFVMFRDGKKDNTQTNIYTLTQGKSNPNVLYAISEPGALFKSIDKGETWTAPCDNLIFTGERPVEVDPNNADIVFAGTQNGIFKSLNGGVNWTQFYINTDVNPNSIIIDPANSNLILVSSDERLLRSLDGGSTWTEEYAGKCFDLKFRPGSSTIIYALMDNAAAKQTEFWRSADSGDTWSKVTNGWPNEPSTENGGGRMTVSDNNPDLIYAYIIAAYSGARTPGDGSKIMKSIDAGLTWTTALNYTTTSYSNNGVDNGQGYYDLDIEVSDTNPNVVYFGTQNRFVTTDGFATTNWAKSGGDLGHSDVQQVLFNGSDLWVTNDGGIIKFTDETFNNFEVKSQGINATSFWSFDQGWNRDAQVGTHYHNGTSARTDSYIFGQFLSYGGAEPEFSALKHPYPDKAWSKGYGEVNGKSLLDNINAPVKNFKYNLFPNKEYGSESHRDSEIEVLPYSYNTHFAGKGNVLYRSDDFGLSWEAIKAFGNVNTVVTKIEIPRANTDVMYVSAYNAGSLYGLYKSTDLGKNFSTLTGPTGMTTTGVHISVDQGNANVLYLASHNGGTANNKIYKSIDGGASWSNLSTDVLDNFAITGMMSVGGTDGGVYLLADRAVFYKNNTMGNWQILINGLPISPLLRDIKPYYKEGKVRIAGDARGVYGADLYEAPTTVIPQPTVDMVSRYCAHDTLFFEDFSIVNHSGASWAWSFSKTPKFIDNPNVRNPKVLFNTGDTIIATMHLTVNGTTYTKQLDKPITIGKGCAVDTIVGRAYDVIGDDKFAIVRDVKESLSAFTVSMWIRPRATQRNTGFVFSTNESLGINFYGDTKNITVHIPGYATWAYNTGLTAEADKWTHVALTSDVATQQIILYVNGVPYNYTTQASSSYKANQVNFNTLYFGWLHQWWGDRYYNGEIDEACIYKKALTRDEVRMQMHHIKNPSIQPDLIHYFQFNETKGGLSYNKIGPNHAEMVTPTVKSRAPLGVGSTSKQSVNTAGIYTFPNEGVTMKFKAGTVPNGEVFVTKINRQPDQDPSNSPVSNGYWVIRNYGSNTTFTGLDSMVFNNIGIASSPYLSNDLSLYKRESGQDGTTWSLLDAGDLISNGSDKITFSTGLNNTTFSQFVIANTKAMGWIGVKSTDWNDPANWGGGIIPTNPSDVIIPPDTPFQPCLSTNVAIHSLTLMKGAQLLVKENLRMDIR
jgi:hypothetical protein